MHACICTCYVLCVRAVGHWVDDHSCSVCMIGMRVYEWYDHTHTHARTHTHAHTYKNHTYIHTRHPIIHAHHPCLLTSLAWFVCLSLRKSNVCVCPYAEWVVFGLGFGIAISPLMMMMMMMMAPTLRQRLTILTMINNRCENRRHPKSGSVSFQRRRYKQKTEVGKKTRYSLC